MNRYRLNMGTPVTTFWITINAISLSAAEMMGRLKAQRSYRYGWYFIKAEEVKPHVNKTKVLREE